MKESLRVLVSVYACQPGKGSESGLGWDHVESMAREHHVWALTRSVNRAAVEARIAAVPLKNATFVYYDLPPFCQVFQSGHLEFLYYVLWQCGAWQVMKRLHEQVGFDITHHVTFATDWLPSLLPRLPVPFVWGPVGGADQAPGPFLKDFSLHGRLFERVRAAIQRVNVLSPLVKTTAKRATLGIASTPMAERRIRSMGCKWTILYPNTALSQEDIDYLGQIPPPLDHPFRVVTLGRLIHWKGGALALRAFARFCWRHPSSEYWVLGDGPEMGRLRKLAHELGVSDRVTFWGHMSRAEVLSKLADCAVLLQPSLHDSGGGVHLEAMAARRPVVCLDIGGPALSVSHECGFKIQPGTPEQCVRDMADALSRLDDDPILAHRMGEAARERVIRSFSWDHRAATFAQLYQAVRERYAAGAVNEFVPPGDVLDAGFKFRARESAS